MKGKVNMKMMVLMTATTVCVLGLLCGCASVSRLDGGAAFCMAEVSDSGNSMNEPASARMMIWQASMSIEVANVSNALNFATEIAEKSGGYVEQKSGRSDKRGSLRLRVPVKSLNAALGSLESLGSVTSRSVEGEDVTEQYIDVEARLKNRIVLRDRLLQLLEKATEVKDILAIETELNRVQADIDSMQGRMKALKGKVDLATIELTLNREKILGPLGYLFKGLFWGVEKLFLIRD